MNELEIIKNKMFENADFLQNEAREYYELADAYRSHGKRDEAECAFLSAVNLEAKFKMILKCMQIFDCDMEYMGITAE